MARWFSAASGTQSRITQGAPERTVLRTDGVLLGKYDVFAEGLSGAVASGLGKVRYLN